MNTGPSIIERFRQNLAYYRALAKHPRTPRASKWLLAAAIAYAVSPIDLIPDFIPVLGHLDDIIVIPLFLLLSLSLIPRTVKEECRQTSRKRSMQG